MRRPRARRNSWLSVLLFSLALVSCWKVDADLRLSAHELNFGTAKDSADVTVTNDSKDNALTAGVTPLDYQFKSDRAWITVTPVSGHCGEAQSATHTVSVDRSGLPFGENLGTVTVTSNGGDETITVRVTRTSVNCDDTPSAPSDPTPENGAANVALATTLSWSGGASQCEGLTAAFDVYFGTESPPPFHHQNGTLKNWNTGTLAANATYYWRIVAKDGNGSTSGPEWSFQTPCNRELTALSLSSPADHATGVSVGVELSWTGGSSQCDGQESTYEVYFGIASPPPHKDDTTAQSWSPGSLEPATTYYWRIVAKDDAGHTRSSSERQFTTSEGACEAGPDEITSLSPADDATVPATQDLSWSGGESQCEGLTATYDVYFGTTSPPPLDHNNGTAKEWDPGTLEPGVGYYWRIVARDANGSQSSPEISFRVGCEEAPDAPCTPSPPDGKDRVNEKATLSWQCGTSNCGLSVTYDVYLGTTPDLGAEQKVASTTVRSWKLEGAAKHTKYYWKVVARNETGSASSPVWSFTTRD
jgi:hypothetical protein